MTNYGCHNKPRPTADSSYIAQRGWTNNTPSRMPVYTVIKSAFGTTDCQYTKQHATDPERSGCVHRVKDAA